MPIMTPANAEQVKQKLEEGMVNDVQVTVFVEQPSKLFVPGRQARGAGMNQETKELMEELAALSPKIKVQLVDIELDSQRPQEFGIDKAPAIVVHNNGNRNARFFGFPGGYEFAALLDCLLKASSGKTNLKAETKELLKTLDRELHIQVFVTPT
jgi:alkyl hydroperoxide reductase subunit AhpF